MHFTATTKNPLLQPLARFASALLIQARSYLTRVQPCHIPGVINDEADALSRYQNGRLKSFEDVITRWLLPPANMSNMPAAATATIRASRLKFIETDRGHVRQSNDQSFDSRSKFFAGWLQSQGHTKQSVAALTPDQLIDTIGAFLEDVKSGKNLQKIQLSGQSLRNYTTAAAVCVKLLTGKMPQYFDPATLSQKRIYLHPYLHDKIAQRMTWSKPQLQKEPFTYRMLAMHAATHLGSKACDLYSSFFGLQHVVWDWL